MNRTRAYLMGLFGLGVMLLLAAESRAQGPGGAPAPGGGAPGGQPPSTQVRPTIAVFNMAAVMREYGKAKYQVYQLTQERIALTADVAKMKAEAAKLQQDIPNQQVPQLKEKMQKDLLELAHRIETRDQEVQTILNKKISGIISQIYDDIKLVVDKTAEMNGYHIVFAYPDVVTPEELAKPEIKELKLKPPAAQPFYIAKQVDVTGVVIQTLNAWYPSPQVPKDAAPVNATPGTTPPTPGNTAPPGAGGVPPKR